MNRSPRVAAGTQVFAALKAALGDVQNAVVRLDRVDPHTTELVRLRCAHHHDCGT